MIDEVERRDLLGLVSASLVTGASGCARDAESTTDMRVGTINILVHNATGDPATVSIAVSSDGQRVTATDVDVAPGAEKTVGSRIPEPGAYRVIAQTVGHRDELELRVENLHLERGSNITVSVQTDEVRIGIQE